MGVRVITKVICDTCTRTMERDGNKPHVLPQHWIRVDLQETSVTGEMLVPYLCLVLCPECKGKLYKALGLRSEEESVE